MDFEAALGRANRSRAPRDQIGIAQHAVRYRVEPEAREVHAVHRHRRDHVDTHAVRTRRQLRHIAHRMIRSEEHTSELQSLMRISYAVFCLINKNTAFYITFTT